MRVVFDTNVFSPGSFEALANSRMRALCKSGRIVPIYGHVFLEETLKAYGVAGARANLLEEWLPFIVETVDRFCDDFVNIWHRELVEGRGLKTNFYMTPKNQRRLMLSILDLPADGSWHGLEGTRLERDTENLKRANQRAISVGIRQEVAALRRRRGKQTRATNSAPGNRIYEELFDKEGLFYILANVPCSNPMAVWHRWARAKNDHPFFTAFLVNMLFMQDFAANTQMKIDLNAQADLDLMTHLLHSHVLVTNETGFLREAFERIWRPRGKVIFSTEQFVDLLNKM